MSETALTTTNHSERVCEVCETRNAIVYEGRMHLCEICAEEQREVVRNIIEKRDEAQLEKQIKYDQSLTMRSEIFNSETASISELRAIIESDGRIDNKEFKLHEVVQEKINHYKKIIFERQSEIVDLNNKIRANQQFLVENANKLRAEEREKLKLQDISYKPAQVKISKPKAPSVKKRIDKTHVRDLVKKLNQEFPALQLAESTFYTMMTVKGRGPEDTYFDFRKKLKEAMSTGDNNAN